MKRFKVIIHYETTIVDTGKNKAIHQVLEELDSQSNMSLINVLCLLHTETYLIRKETK
jgi:flavorubredoxin